MKKTNVAEFQKTILDFYAKNGRHDLPWRKTKNPYRILVSEVMLQQTQVERVIPKYKTFLRAFPTIESLAQAPLSSVIGCWSGLGYNRRALYLQKTAQVIVRDFGGRFPKDPEILETLSGIGPYTARAIATFSYDAPYTFIETNIRRVFIHTFFPRKESVSDSELLPIIGSSLPQDVSPRIWYFALMDYGSYLKSTIKNPNRKSTQYTKQSVFKGSVRELRGEFLRLCQTGKIAKRKLLASYEKKDSERAEKALVGLVRDGILDIDARGYVRIH